jgi:drug/metabolite transporter (DMT)-like permease
MFTTVMVAVLFGAFLHALWNALVHTSANKAADMTIIVMGAGIFGGILLPFLPLPNQASWPNLVASAGIHTLYFLLTVRSYRSGDLSLVYPLTRGSAPLLSTIAAILLLDEFPSTLGWAGVLLIVCGISVQALHAWQQEHSRAAAKLALTNAGVIACYTLVDGTGIRLSGNPFSYISWMFFLTALTLTIFLSIRKASSPLQLLRASWRRGVMGGMCTFGSYGLALWAMANAPIALVAALRETSVVFVLLIAKLVLREHLTLLRYGSAIAVTAGALAIRFA